MRLFLTSLAAVAMIFAAVTSARADLAESGSSASSNANKAAAPAVVDPKKPPQVRSNYQQPKIATGARGRATATEPIKLLPTAKARKTKRRAKRARAAQKKRKVNSRRRTATRRTSQVQTSPSDWWDRTGNGLVLKFRDCVSEYAANRPPSYTRYGSQLMIASAMDHECRETFDAMASQITARLGKEKFAELSPQLIEDVFLPAVEEARNGPQASAEAN